MRLPEDLAALKRAQPAQAAAMLRDGHTAAEVVAAINATNLDLHRRVLDSVLARQATPPPVPFALLAMGSLGRGESLLAPDQDNGFILEDYRTKCMARWMPGSAPSPPHSARPWRRRASCFALAA